MTKVLAIAGVTVRDALRQRLAVNLLLFALLVIGASQALAELTFGEQYRIIADLTLTAAGIFGTLIAVFLGANLIAGDVQRRSLYPVLAKPVSRTQYVLGRYAGLLAVLLLNLGAMALTTVAVLAFYRRGFGFLASTPLLLAFAGLAVQLAMVAAIATAFSTFTNVTLAAIATLALAVAGHSARVALPFWRSSGFGRAVALFVPNLASLDWKVAVVYSDGVPDAPLLLAYGALYTATALALGAAVFARRDLR